MTQDEIRIAFERALLEWPLWQAWHKVLVHSLPDDRWTVSYRTEAGMEREWRTGFEINIDGPICYLLSISITQFQRNKGFGSKLYELIETAAASLGLEYVMMLPSGTTPRGETREAYLLRRGYQKHQYSDQVYKELPRGKPPGTAAASGDLQPAVADSGPGAAAGGASNYSRNPGPAR